jgi:hypothetical protein
MVHRSNVLMISRPCESIANPNGCSNFCCLEDEVEDEDADVDGDEDEDEDEDKGLPPRLESELGNGLDSTLRTWPVRGLNERMTCDELEERYTNGSDEPRS